MKPKSPFLLILFFTFFCSVIFLFLFSLKNIKLGFGNYFSKNNKAKSTNLNSKENQEKDLTITIKENEINDLLLKNNLITEANTEITENGITVIGNVKKVINLNITLTAKISVRNSKSEIDIIEAKGKYFSIPSWLLKNISKNIDGYLNSQINDKMTVKNIEYIQDQITITGEKL